MDDKITTQSSRVPEIPVNMDKSKESKQIDSVTLGSALQSYALLEAKAKAETAELEKRLVMQNFRPCKLYPVILYHDGLRWVCAFGIIQNQFADYLPDDIADAGVVAYGMSPEEAMQNFDRLWCGVYEDDIDDDDNDEDEDEE